MRIVALLCAAASVLLAQERIWEGVYTEAQATRGREAYLKSCTNCHNLDLAGSVRGPALKGDRFMSTWQNGSVANLYRKIRDFMPATYPDSVAEDVKIDVLAYLLKENSFPAGKAELRLDEKDLEEIQITQKGSSGVPNFTLVQVFGCLEGGSETKWKLTHATEPVAIKEDAPRGKAPQRFGAATFLLVSAGQFNPESHRRQQMEARGLLYRDASGARLNLTSFERNGVPCPVE
jgi:S-disulfanyl-L-cysteine oxidoreductase SoxD